jgi:hypothetical protein
MGTRSPDRRREDRSSDSLERAWRERHRNPSGLRQGDPQLAEARSRPASEYRQP